ncbi:hypothetical protein EKO27_g5840 [Xylaria grammica]|uniref:FAD linked oxidase N-terminal domain-containing protein n=1 Tax=Xylaria grammica TaxID=363999 RepID=A0A439D4G6_9PEZI|nr:hypothetical protein EKO27_g5840 [Xylaria grammica]
MSSPTPLLSRWRRIDSVATVLWWSLSAICQANATLQWLSPTAELADRLSPGALIYSPGSDGFTQATSRWSVYEAPNISLVVVPSVENDVAETVKYANQNNLPFIAVSGGHGAIITESRVQNGIEIWMNQLNTVEIDGYVARVDGGALTKTVSHALWQAGKQTVLASGDIKTIDRTCDLWWAMQGAGHNFGIVTSVSVKIYDIQYPDWAYEMFTFTGDKVEGLFDNLNVHLLRNGWPPVNIVNFAIFKRVPEIDVKPIIYLWIFQEGATSVDSAYSKPFHHLGPSATGVGSGTYLDVPRWLGWDSDAPSCQNSGLANTRFPIDIRSYNVQAVRKAYDLFTDVTQKIPELNGSRFLFEGYSLQGVKAVPGESTAYAFREDNLLVAPVISWTPSGPDIARKATDFGKRLRQIIYEGTGRSELHSYVNYAFGDETPQNWYGYERQRQQRLLGLKNNYDPDRKFSFYAPIA